MKPAKDKAKRYMPNSTGTIVRRKPGTGRAGATGMSTGTSSTRGASGGANK